VRVPHRLRWFTTNLPAFDSEIKRRVTHERNWGEITSEVKYIGAFGGRKVVDVLFSTTGSEKPVAKLILLGDRSQFRPVVWILDDAGVTFTPSRIIEVAGTPVLVSRHRVSGTGNFYFEDYFVFDRDKAIPINLGIDAVIAAELARTLPPGRSVWKGGGFDIDSLRYSSGVWNEHDANCCPTGGRIEMTLGIRGNTVIVRDARYHAPSRSE
jgi:hypothetical protein